ncbi:MAG: hypothetical protein KJN84_06190, partial [Bacteroidia bacterium]|nr:hypothetical protein [Bacteroidia bacterium]
FLKYDINDKLSIIAIAGNSTNYHAPVDSIESASVLKDLQDISFESKFLITGISYKGKKFEHNLFYSQRNNERTSLLDTTVFYSPDLNPLDFYIRKSQKLSYNGKGNFINDNLVLGVQALIGYDELLKDLSTLKGETITLRPYAQWQYLKQIGQGQFKLQPGLALNYIRDEKLKIEPSLFSQYGIGNFLLDFNYGIKNKDQELNNSERNRLNSERMESLSFAVKYNLPKESLSFMSRVFYLNAKTKSYRLYSYINSLNNFNFDYNIGSGDFFERQNIESRGIELMIDKSWSQGWYTNINVSLFDARYKDLDINTNENFKRIFNISVTKEFLTKKNNRWVFNLAYHQRGGGYQNVIETLNSYVTERRLSSYKRLDARFQYNWNRRNILTLDIQNLIGFSNEGYYYFDAFANEELLESQLGTIPILSYKRIL